jgi:hypothetical protein
MAVKRYDGSAWQTVAGLGAQGAAATSSSIATWVKTASGGETSLSGNDDNSQALSYTVGQELVFINGALQKRGDDYTATTGNSITGLAALTANDIVTVWTVNAFSVTNAISNTLVDAKGDLVTATSADVPARLAVGSNNTVLTADSSTATGLKWATPSAAAFVGCSLYKSANQSINDATYTAVTFDLELFDTDAFHNTSTNTSRITIPAGKGGKYLFVATADHAANTTGIRQSGFWKNGSIQKGQVAHSAASGGETKQTVSAIYDLVATDYVEFYVYQNSGAARNLLSDGTIFSCQYLGA